MVFQDRNNNLSDPQGRHVQFNIINQKQLSDQTDNCPTVFKSMLKMPTIINKNYSIKKELNQSNENAEESNKFKNQCFSNKFLVKESKKRKQSAFMIYFYRMSYFQNKENHNPNSETPFFEEYQSKKHFKQNDQVTLVLVLILLKEFQSNSANVQTSLASLNHSQRSLSLQTQSDNDQKAFLISQLSQLNIGNYSRPGQSRNAIISRQNSNDSIKFGGFFGSGNHSRGNSINNSQDAIQNMNAQIGKVHNGHFKARPVPKTIYETPQVLINLQTLKSDRQAKYNPLTQRNCNQKKFFNEQESKGQLNRSFQGRISSNQTIDVNFDHMNKMKHFKSQINPFRQATKDMQISQSRETIIETLDPQLSFIDEENTLQENPQSYVEQNGQFQFGSIQQNQLNLQESSNRQNGVGTRLYQQQTQDNRFNYQAQNSNQLRIPLHQASNGGAISSQQRLDFRAFTLSLGRNDSQQ
ncbi:UNKNOWN [Stylonychia lemnae]|uniref:Uncharacterized protein n=1 Tax=Stylonychia lemnae TaxID=5949 RepID=A0A078B7J0_STYLE|nr:UNKNOWN [Stylonychia lemnae]|eukprot:CDW89508.1 UNKNOWN [Stylonychia lemnae]